MTEVTTNIKNASLKRVLAWCLAICMCLTLVQVNVLASNTNKVAATATNPNATDANAHTHQYKVKYVKATATKDGSITKTCKKCGKVVKTKLYKASKITLAKTSYTYTGKAIKPVVTVKDSKGKKISAGNYTVTYKNNKKVGTATVTIKFKGNRYKGTVKKSFRIVPAARKITKLTANKKGFTAKWARNVSVTGYQVRYATNSKLSGAKTVTVKGYKTLTKKIAKLSSKKTYYVQVRTYKKVNGKNYASAWSKTAKVKTK